MDYEREFLRFFPKIEATMPKMIRMQAIANHLARTADHGPKRWTIRLMTSEVGASGRTPESAIRKLLKDPRAYKENSFRALAGEEYQTGRFTATGRVEDYLPHMHMPNLDRDVLLQDRAARGDKRARKMIRRTK